MKLVKPIILLLISIYFLPLIAIGQKYNIEHCEPPFWWTQMKNNELQIMIHGKDIASLNPEINYPGIKIKKSITSNNKNYLFIYLNISEETPPGIFEITFKIENQTVLKYNYKLLERMENSANRLGFDNSDVIYLITPDRFANGITENDDIPGYNDKANRNDITGRHGGDIQGIIDHLDYISDMGFTSIWLNPLLDNNMKRVSYHGYSTTDYYKIDPRFGNNNDYKRLCTEANKIGIKIIMDQIMNHCGLEHWWMKDLPSNDWINNMDKYQQTSHRRTSLHDPYATESDKKKFTDGWFVPSMPDLNQNNPLLADYLIQNSIWWIEFADLKGIRHDTHPYPGNKFMAKWTCRIMDEYPNMNIVGEEWSENPIVVAKWQKGNTLLNNLSSCLPSLMDFPLQITFNKALTDKETWNSGLFKVYEMLANDIIYPDPYNLVVFADNHDMDRFFTQVNEDLGLYKIGMAFYLTTRGIPQIFYGTEILMKNPGTSEHGIIRSDFPGGWEEDKVDVFNNIALSSQQSEALEYLKKLLNWRKNNEVIHTGKLVHYAPENGLYCYFRYNKDKKIMIILNKNDRNFNFKPDNYTEMLSSHKTGINVLDGKEYVLDNLIVPSKSPLIIELK